MNILIEDFHTKHVKDICLIGENFYVINNSEIHNWDTLYGLKPDNLFFDYDPRLIKFDCAIVAQERFLKEAKEKFGIPVVCIKGGEAGERELLESDILVTTCKRNLQASLHQNKTYIHHGVDPDIFNGYNGVIPFSITTAHGLNNRPELRKELVDQITNIDFPCYRNIYIGMGSDHFANGISAIRFEEIVNFYRCFRCMVYTPTSDAGMGYAITEAMMTGMPAILTDFADWKEYIINWKSGIVSDDLEELTAFYREIITNHKFAMQVSAAIREVVLENFTIDGFINKWKDLLKVFDDAGN